MILLVRYKHFGFLSGKYFEVQWFTAFQQKNLYLLIYINLVLIWKTNKIGIFNLKHTSQFKK
ncbi:hypothetical protein BpHYR1_039694 [Brachionus plicatilis]|uniref:Uncharacterized protein n=1 Tax=Brachionus plicatilis TaxID=10195 RepID=A0A3M7QCM3_BRAPC|nr:hypothetical protein BpHYR1_039694 [Brachionus plicatilis]